MGVEVMHLRFENRFIKKQSIPYHENNADRSKAVVKGFQVISSTISRMMLRTRAISWSLRLWSFLSLDVIISPPFDSKVKARPP